MILPTYDLTFSTIWAKKPSALLHNCLPAYWYPGNFSPLNNGTRQWTQPNAVLYAKEVTRTGPDNRTWLNECARAMPAGVTTRMAVIDVEGKPGISAPKDDAEMLYAIQLVRAQLPKHQISIAGHMLGGLPDANFQDRFFQVPKIRDALRAKCRTQLPMVRAAGTVWAGGYMTEPESLERDLITKKNQLTTYRELFAGTPILLWIFGKYVTRSTRLNETACKRLLAIARTYCQGLVLWGPWQHNYTFYRLIAAG